VIDSVTIHGFKSIKDRLLLELGRVNVFVGPNGSGKSAILEAVGVLGAAAEGRVDDLALMRRGVRPGVPALYKSSFAGSRHRRMITLRADSGAGPVGVSYEVGLDNPIERPKPAWTYHTESVRLGSRAVSGYSRSRRSRDLPVDEYTGLAAQGLGRREFPSEAAELVHHLQSYAIYSPTTAILRGLEPDPQQRSPVGLGGGRLAEAVADLVKMHNRDEDMRERLLTFVGLLTWVKSMGIRAAEPRRDLLSEFVPMTGLTVSFEDRFMREGRNRLLAYDASEGALYILFLAVLSLHPKASAVFAVDNFDHALNPRVARAVTRAMCEYLTEPEADRQVLLTTHNPLVLDGLDLRNDQVRLFTVDRDSGGGTIVRRVVLDHRLLSEAEKGLSLSRLWTMGRLGGMPNV